MKIIKVLLLILLLGLLGYSIFQVCKIYNEKKESEEIKKELIELIDIPEIPLQEKNYKVEIEYREQTEIEGLKAGKMAVKGDVAYIMCNDYYAEGDKNSIVVYDLKNEVILSANFVTDGTELGTLNGIGVDPVSGDVYVSQSDSNNNGDVSIFSSDGKLKSKLEVEVYPADIAFATGYKLPEE